MVRLAKIAAILAGISALPALHLPAAAQSTPPMGPSQMIERTVSVSASGVAVATPDIAHINTGVQTEAPTAREAMAANSVIMAKVIAGLKAAGLDASDIRTTAVNINPRYVQPIAGKPATINGYFAKNQVRITVRDLPKLGGLLDTSLTLGATQLGGISFDVSQAETLRDEARKTAVANERKRAELYATAAGVSLGDVLTIAEDQQTIGPRPQLGVRAAGAVQVPVEAGSLQIETTVHMVWQLR